MYAFLWRHIYVHLPIPSGKYIVGPQGPNNNKSSRSELTAINEVRKRIVYILDDIFSSTNSCMIWCMMFSFHIQDFDILENYLYSEIFHILDFYMNFYTFLYQAFYILENLSSILCKINYGYLYKLYTHWYYLLLLETNRITFNQSHHTFSFWTIDSPLSMK